MRIFKDSLSDFHKRIDDIESWMKDTDKHITKYVPLQTSTLIYDILLKNFRKRVMPKLKENFNSLFTLFERNIKSADLAPYTIGDYNFKKLDYTIP